MTNLTIEQKASLTSGATTWTSKGIEGHVDSMHMSDGPHGLRYQGVEGDSLGIASSVPATCFPPAAGLASTWDREMVERVGRTLGEESRSLGVSVLLGPGLNIKRSPLGGRNFEYASEDPFLAGAYGASFVRGVQSKGVSAVPKHFAANNQETDRIRVSAMVNERTLREIYLPAFETTVKQARPWAFMCAYNKLNGVYASENEHLLTDILRREWGFDGVVISDWGAVNDRVAAVRAGLDIEMPPSNTDEDVVQAVAEGNCPEEVLDSVVERVERLADRTRSVRSEPRGAIDFKAHDQVAREAAREAIVLLKNTGILPLDTTASKPIAIIGELARTPRYQGGGSSHVTTTITHDLLTEMTKSLPNASIAFAPGYTLDESVAPDAELVEQARQTAQQAQCAIVSVGYLDSDESEGSDKTSIDLRADQQAVLEAVLATGTPTIIILSGGGIVRLGDWAQQCDALIEGWLLGQAGGAALADVLTGVVSPSGRLNESIPLSLDDTPCRLNFPGSDGVVVYGEGLYVGYRYYDTLDIPVAYPFGFGLSYSAFEYSALEVKPTSGSSAVVSFTVTNTGSVTAADVPQIYVANGQSDRPVHELKGFERIELDPGESRTLTIELDTRAFATWNARQSHWRVYPGTYGIELAHSSRDIHERVSIDLDGDAYIAPLEAMSTIAEWTQNPYGAQLIDPLIKKVTAVVGGGEPSAQMREMFMQSPLVKLASWGIGLTIESVEAMTQQANELRAKHEDVNDTTDE